MSGLHKEVESRQIGHMLLSLHITEISILMAAQSHPAPLRVSPLIQQTMLGHGKIKNLMLRAGIGYDGCRADTWFTTIVLILRGFLKAFLMSASVRGSSN